MKKKFFATMMVAAIAGICVMTSCSKENTAVANEIASPKVVALTLDRSGVDALAKDLATLHNYELFKLHDNTKLAQLSVPQQCLFVRKQIFQDYQKLLLII